MKRIIGIGILCCVYAAIAFVPVIITGKPLWYGFIALGSAAGCVGLIFLAIWLYEGDF